MEEILYLSDSETMDLENIVPEIQYVVGKRCLPSWHLSEAVLDFHNFMLVLEGEVYISYNLEEKYHTVTGGYLIYSPRGVSRKAYTNADNPMNCYAVNFDYALCKKMGGRWHFNENTPRLPIGEIIPIRNMEALASLLKEMNREWQGKKRGYIMKCRILLMELLQRIFRESRFYSLDAVKLRKVEKVMNYVAEHHQESVSLRQMADMAGLSPVYFGSIFKELSGYTPKEYQNFVRVHKAKDLLLSGGYNVGEAAASVGYNDIYYFSRIFKRITGHNPSEFK